MIENGRVGNHKGFRPALHCHSSSGILDISSIAVAPSISGLQFEGEGYEILDAEALGAQVEDRVGDEFGILLLTPSEAFRLGLAERLK